MFIQYDKIYSEDNEIAINNVEVTLLDNKLTAPLQSNISLSDMFNRPGVAGAVLKSPLLLIH